MTLTRSEHIVTENGARVEIGTFVHEGKEFAAMGSVIDPNAGVLVGYPKDGRLLTWDGGYICEVRCISTWKTPRSWQSSTRSAYRATFLGSEYHGTGFGDGMLLKLHRSKAS